MDSPRRHVFVLIALLAGLVVPAVAATPTTEPDPRIVLRNALANGQLRRSGTGELFCWHAASSANVFLDAYEAYGNPEWLAAAEEYYAFYLDKLQTDPDGYEGWIGDPVGTRGRKLSTDAVVGDAILSEPLARFAWIVLKKDPHLKPRFGDTAEKYVRLATRICWEKWNHRGCYYEDASGWGSYHTYGKLVDLEADEWVDAPSRVISNNLNKHYSVAHVLLRLWRITGKDEYKERVKAVFGRAKTMWRYYPDQDRVVWNFWMPHGPYDLDGRAPASWVAVHPSRAGYQAGEVADWVEVYDSGLVFTKKDLQRIIRTNHWMMPASERGWRNADGTSDAGTLWPALARFDDRIRGRLERRLNAKDTPRNRIAMAYLKNVTEKHLGFERRYCDDESKVEIVDVPLQPGRNITMSVVIPDTVELVNDAPVQLACQTREAGTLTLDLLDASGERELGTLHTIRVGDRTEYNAPFFDGTNPATGEKTPGRYTIRWTLDDESRTQPVYVVQGTKRERTGLESLAAGETLSEDFEGDLDPRWQLERCTVTDEKAHRSDKSLKVDGRATLTFGDTSDLPVRIIMWVWDAGEKKGDDSATGPGWGVKTALGDTFAIRQMWRAYIAGDREYMWLNTGENQWFNPHPAGVARRRGWNRWVFDFTDPDNVTITGNTRPVRGLTAKYTPGGAVAIRLIGSESGGPLYVDDITIERAR